MNTHGLRHLTLSVSTVTALGLGACSGGGTSPIAPPSGSVRPATAAPSRAMRKLGFTLAGNVTSLARIRSNGTRRRASATDGAPLSVSYNGAIVATGSLDASGFAELTFTQDVPAGATVIVTVGSGANAIVASVPLVDAIAATAVVATYNAGPPATLTIARSEDMAGNGAFNASAGENETETENAQTGEVESVDDQNDGHLPGNLPIVITACGSTFTIALNANASPAPSGSYVLDVEEKHSDDESEHQASATYHIDPFMDPVTFAAAPDDSRVFIMLAQNGSTILDIKAPLGSHSDEGQGTPGSCPTVSPSSAPTVAPSSSPDPMTSPSSPPTTAPSASPMASTAP